MRRTVTLACLLGTAAASACDSLGPGRRPEFAGTYVLTAVGGGPPPRQIGELREASATTHLDSATLVVTSDTTVRRMLGFRDVVNQVPRREYASVFRYNGRYRRAGNTVVISYPDRSEVSVDGEDTVAVLDGRIRVGLRGTLTYAAQSLEYARR